MSPATVVAAPSGDVDPPRLPARELLGVALQGLRTRRLRAALSALGIAIGIGAMVAVVGVSASAQANLLAEIDALGTNLLTVSPGVSFRGGNRGAAAHGDADDRPHGGSAAGRRHLPARDRRGATHPVRAEPRRPAGSESTPRPTRCRRCSASGCRPGIFSTRSSNRYPEVVLGSEAASVLQIEHVGQHLLVYLDDRWFEGRWGARTGRARLVA